jgi:hypothetical protein
VLGRGLLAELGSVGGALAVGGVVYALGVRAFNVPEARQIEALVARRRRSRDER